MSVKTNTKAAQVCAITKSVSVQGVHSETKISCPKDFVLAS